MVEDNKKSRILRPADLYPRPSGLSRVTAVLEGELNVNEVFSPLSREILRPERIRRHPKRNTRIFQALAYEYNGIGFTKDGGKMRRRSPEEQIRFIEHCVELGLKVLPTLRYGNNGMESVFLHGAQKFDDYLLRASPEQANRVTFETFMDLFKAHKNGVIYGDRWAENILVVPGLGIVNIDFDIEITGPHVREFEAAQIATYIVGGSKAAALPLLSRILTAPKAGLDIRYLESFLHGHEKYYDADKKYGPIDQELTTLVTLMHKEQQANSRG